MSRPTQVALRGLPPLRRAQRRLALLPLALLAACVPDPRGSCALDADCAGGPTGSFCAEGVCQAAPRAALELPAGSTARSATAAVRVRVSRAHGGPESATARAEAGSLRIAGVREADGAIRLDLPASFAPAGADGPAPFAVFVADDLGHEARLDAALAVDDRGPSIAVDPASLPAAPALRGSHVALRVRLTDPSGPGGLRFSVGGGALHDAAAQADGSFLADVDTREAPPDAAQAQVQWIARDALGNEARSSAAFAITRVKWISHSGDHSLALGLALGRTSVLVTTEDHQLARATRDTGQLTLNALPGPGIIGRPVVDVDALYTAVSDGRVCKLNLDGSVRWCCTSAGPIAGSPALGYFTSLEAGGPPVPMLLVTAVGTNGSLGRLFAIRESATGSCERLPSYPLALLDPGTPAIAADGTIYVAGLQALVAARFDGYSLIAQAYPVPGSYVGQPALAAPVASGSGAGQRVLLAGRHSALEAQFFAPPATAGGLPSGPSQIFSATVSSNTTNFPTSPVLAEDGSALLGVPDADALAAVAADGSVRWTAALPGRPFAAPLAGDRGLVYAATDDGSVTALDLASGKPVWSWSAGAPIRATPALGCDGVLYGATDSGDLFALVTDSTGPADSPWPREGHDPRGTGDGRRALRGPGESCVEE